MDFEAAMREIGYRGPEGGTVCDREFLL